MYLRKNLKMIILPLFVALTVTVGHVMGQPPPSAVPLACQLDMSCFSNYETAVVGSDPCKAAKDFKACTMSAQAGCTDPIPENIADETAKAEAAVKEKCDIEDLPACASICLPYETKAEADWADQRPEQGCDQYQLYRTCLQNFENTGNCNVTSYLTEANTREKTKCTDACSVKYSRCTNNLLQLANDPTKSQILCQEWNKCKKYDYSVCDKTLTLNYDTECAPTSEPPLTPPPIPSASTEDCKRDTQCEDTYSLEVNDGLGTKCKAAENYKACTRAVQNTCKGPIPPEVQADTTNAESAERQHCGQVPECASICPPYESSAEADWTNSKQKSGCDQYQLYRTCLQNFEDAGNCNVTSFLNRAIIRQNENCNRTCSEIYDDCSKYLPLLAKDDSKQTETCQLWSLCNGYDFSPCQKTLTFNYDAQCGNGVSGVTASFGLVAAMFSFLLL